MRKWVKGLAWVSFGVLAGAARAEEPRWAAVQTQPAAGVALAPPSVTLDRPRPVAVTSEAPAASLGRPVAVTALASQVTDAHVARTSYQSLLLAAPYAVARGQAEERPMPLGPKSSSSNKEIAEAGPTLETAPAPRSTNRSPTVIPPSDAIMVDQGSGMMVDESPSWSSGASDEWWWVRGEYLMWWINQSHSPPLVTASPAGTPRESAGILGLPTTTVLVGGDRLSSDSPFHGGRITVGGWITDDHALGLEGNFLFLGQKTTHFSASSAGSPILVRPFFEVSPLVTPTSAEAGELVAFPGLLAGTVSGSYDTKLWGAELNTRVPLWSGCWYQVDFLGGGRYLDLRENLNINEALTVTSTPGVFTGGVFIPGGTQILVADHFGTRNEFYGGQVGIEAEARWRRWYIDTLAKVAFGNVHEVVNINGTTTFALPGAVPVTQPGGLLALPTNSGHFTRDRFAALPEGGFKVGYQWTEHLRTSVGYSFMYLSNAVRPGEQVDRVVNTSQLPSIAGPGVLVGQARPGVLLRETDFWAQGLDFGIEFRY